MAFRKTILILCVSVLIFGAIQGSLADSMTDVEAYFSQDEGYSGLVEVPGSGLVRYYAQNDPLWGDLIYEKEGVSTKRPFRDSGCSPTALAMAVAALIPGEQLSRIADFAKREYSLCSCSLSKARCTHNHTRYVLTTQRDYERFLPLVFGDFAARNNTRGVTSRTTSPGTASAYLQHIADVYGLTLRFEKSYDKIKDLVGQENTAVVVLAGRHGAFTTVGHYMYLAGKDEKYMYILDPLSRKGYNKFPNGYKLTVLQPGLVAMPHNFSYIGDFGSFIVLEKPAPSAEPAE